MKNYITLLFGFLLSVPTALKSQDISEFHEIRNNTIVVTGDSMTGSGIIYNFDNTSYIITARHLFKKHNSNGCIVAVKYGKTNVIKEGKYKYGIHQNPNIDIAILKLDTFYRSGLKLSINSEITPIMDCYLVGYPNSTGIVMTVDKFGNRYPLYFKGIYSGFFDETLESPAVHLIDATNINGMSGGIVFNIRDNKFVISSIISGYYQHEMSAQGNQISMQMLVNSGLTIATPAIYAVYIMKFAFQN